MALSGKYELVREEGQLEHLLAAGLPEEFAKKSLESKTLEISITGDKIQISREKGPQQNLTVNETLQEKTHDGKIMKHKALLSGDVLTIETDTEKGTFKRTFRVNGSELTVISSRVGVPDGKRIFKKL